MTRRPPRRPPDAPAARRADRRRLDDYRGRRDPAASFEPFEAGTPSAGALRSAMQNHDATRLEWGGVLLIWAVTRGPSLDPADKRLVVRTEDHPLPYLSFEGMIPAASMARAG